MTNKQVTGDNADDIIDDDPLFESQILAVLDEVEGKFNIVQFGGMFNIPATRKTVSQDYICLDNFTCCHTVIEKLQIKLAVSGGRNSSEGSAWTRCPQRRGFDPPLGTFSGRGDFSLGVNMGSNFIPPKTPSDESINRGLVCAHMHFIARTQKILTFMS